MVVGHVGNSCLFFEKMLAEPEDSEDTIDSREFHFVQIQVYIIVLFYDSDIVVVKVFYWSHQQSG